MQVKQEKRQILRVPAELTSEQLGAFFAALDRTIATAADEITLECSSLHRATPSHVTILWQAHMKCAQSGVAVCLASVSPGLERVLRMLDLYEYLINKREVAEPQADRGDGRLDRRHAHELRLEFKAMVDDINQAMRRFHDFLKDTETEEIIAFELETVFYEVAMNIHLHGGLQQDDTIGFTAQHTASTVVLRFVDQGPRFDPTCGSSTYHPQAAIQARQSHGLGLTMIKRMIDRVSYERENDRSNVFILEKSIPSTTGEPR